MLPRDRLLLARDTAAVDGSAQHPVNRAVAVIGAAVAILTKCTAKFRQDDHHRILPLDAK